MIIFDLDDTLIDTSGAIGPFKMRLCLKKMIDDGLDAGDFEKAYADLIAINRKSLKSTDALEAFGARYRATRRQIGAAIGELTAPLPDGFAIPTTPHAKEILEYYRKICPVALVTGGHPPLQWDKLKKAGIDSSVFSMIAIPEDSKKKPYYEAAQREFSKVPSEIWVCGDRVGMDLEPANELGFRTVLMRWGRGALAKAESWIGHTISDLRELKEIVRKL